MMNTENNILLKRSREALRGNWGPAIITFLICMLISASVGAIGRLGSLLSLIISGPLALGMAYFSLAISRRKEASLELVFEGFRRFQTSLMAYLTMIVIVILWSLLLIIPGIISALSYALTFYILADEPSLTSTEALTKSKKLMYGHKLKLFYLCLHFFLLMILCILTLGIGFLWLVPYVHVTMATFYDDIKKTAPLNAVI